MRISSAFLICILVASVLLTACNTAMGTGSSASSPADTPEPLATISAPPSTTTIPQSTLTVKPGWIDGKLDVGGHELYIHCEGQGSPTIILEAALGLNSEYFSRQNFFNLLSQTTLTCVYDRPNTGGKSDSVLRTRTVQDVVDDLHRLLVNGPIPGPYLLAGHSLGGYITRLYASQYPQEVVGMVLLDSTHPDFGLRMNQLIPTEAPGESDVLSKFRWDMDHWYANGAEWLDLLTSAEQVRAVTSLGDLPLYVLTSDEYPNTFPAELRQEISDAGSVMGQELVGLSTQGMLVKIPDAGHFLWYSQVTEVVKWIAQMVELVRQ